MTEDKRETLNARRLAFNSWPRLTTNDFSNKNT